MKSRESLSRIIKPIDIEKLVHDGLYVSNESIDFLMQKVDQEIMYKSVMTQAPSFATKLSLSTFNRIINVLQPGHGEPVQLSLEQEEP